MNNKSYDKNIKYQPSSFRDPSGYLFFREGILYRQINNSYREHYDKLIESGLYEKLVGMDLLIPHREVNIEELYLEEVYKIIEPESVSFINYPYEWSFSQLKDAALTTLEIQKISLEYGMTLKDASAYNIQFYKGKPVLIDTLSFEKYDEGSPWVAYRQFCQHFLAPLALMSYCDVRLSQLLKYHLDGIPLDLTSNLLPTKTKLRFSLMTNIHLHAKGQKHFGEKTSTTSTNENFKKMGSFSLKALIDSLESAVKKLNLNLDETIWADYYEKETSNKYLEDKKEIVKDFLGKTRGTTAWDIGANTGVFSNIAAKQGYDVISMDLDPLCVEKNYNDNKEKNLNNILPLLIDFTNPSPPIGWENEERMSIFQRGPADTVLALALVHHLAIGNNVPLKRLAKFFLKTGQQLLIEFIPKTDEQVQRLLSHREDIFAEYNQDNFEGVFKEHFKIKDKTKIPNSERTLYLMVVDK